MKTRKIPAYFIALKVYDDKNIKISSDFGAASCEEYHRRTLTPTIRVGNNQLDNFKEKTQTRALLGLFSYKNIIPLPLDNSSLPALRQTIWNGVTDRYQEAAKQYEKLKRKGTMEKKTMDHTPCFSTAPIAEYYEPLLPKTAYEINSNKWKKRLNEVSSVFKECNALSEGKVTLESSILRTHLVTSEGTVVVQNKKTYQLSLIASIKTGDGITVPLSQKFLAFSEDELPKKEELITVARDLTNRLLKLQKAPKAEAYSGPAILSGKVSALLFHQLFGQRLEANRTKGAANKFSKMPGQNVLPESMQVISDPSLRYYKGFPLYGHYLYDDEGTKAQRVECVKNGVLHQFLTSRTPMKGFQGSNGHGRAAIGQDPTACLSNLMVETTQPYSEEQLREMLISELKQQKKDFGYFVRTPITNGPEIVYNPRLSI